MKVAGFACCLLHPSSLLGLSFNPKGGGDIGWLLMDYAALELSITVAMRTSDSVFLVFAWRQKIKENLCSDGTFLFFISHFSL
jgi:hypothetical protein